MRRMVSWARGLHMPHAYLADDGRMRCHDCGRLVTRYTMRGLRSWRHHPRGRR